MLIRTFSPGTGVDPDEAAAELGIPADLAEDLPAGNDGDDCEWHEVPCGDYTVGVLWFPQEGRAGCTVVGSGTGNARWTDALSVEDAVQRFATDDMTG